ncbi:type VI secretion system accessory protein TagJ [Methylobacter sp. YRD-M1]|uniref:type VI secretion system accessory protein TagJ n=1 Tax=Methylobacter sp. YRD-M1 TaxID=2911520 RepID=UPI00227C91CD|nr:type VI secretion system accessory protein TagJ [Methylobacter sp. YRD-M1]WAK00358.1 tetratricopeptide repeat protein [Methylobacter sp. YRD-M1]
MKLAEQHLQEGRLQEALAELQNQVRRDPANPKLRTFLFQLLAVIGEWDRALTQLNVAGELDAANLPMVQTYREAIRCEVLRKEIFSGHKTPVVFGDPAQWVALLQEALKLAAEHKFAEAKNLRDQAFALAPATPGFINGNAFNWIADADTRLGPMLEAIVNGHYYWVPFHQIREIHIEEPADLRDFVWMPVHFIWANGGEAFGLIPTRYPDSESADDSAIRLSRKTEWQEQAEESFIGLGQRLLSTDQDDYAVMDIREIKLNVD